jgi:hypothetical protein
MVVMRIVMVILSFSIGMVDENPSPQGRDSSPASMLHQILYEGAVFDTDGGCWWVQSPENQTTADFERLGELEYGLLVWRTNLKRDLAFTHDAGVGHGFSILRGGPRCQSPYLHCSNAK